MNSTPPSTLRRYVFSVLATLPLFACGAVRTVTGAPGKMSDAITGDEEPKTRPLAELHSTTLALADFMGLTLQTATREFATQAGTPEARIQAVQWRLDGSRRAYNAATGPVPLENLIDLLLMTINGRLALERNVAPEAWGEPARPVLAAFVELEARVWSVVADFYPPDQVSKLRTVTAAWEERRRSAAPDVGTPLPTVAEVLADLHVDDGSDGGLFGFMEIDPFAGLEPAAREIALSRQFAERTLFWSQRLPILIEAETELAVLHAQRLPEVIGIFADTARVSNAADSLAKTAALLPDQLRAEREAALKQLSEEVTAQREGLVRDIETSRAPLEALLAESRGTFEAAQGMSVEVAEALRVLDAFVGRFDKPKSEPDAEPKEPGKPFDISEYGATAARLGEAAAELRQLVTTLDTSLPQVEQMVGTAAARGEAVVDHAFRRGLQLGLALVGAAAIAMVLVRLATARLTRARA